MSSRSRRKPAPAPSGVTTEERFKSLEDAVTYLARRVKGPEVNIEAVKNTLSTLSANGPRAPSTRDSLDEILAKVSRLNGHLDALNNYMFGGAPGGALQAGDAPTPSSAHDKTLLIDSRITYALAATEELLNRF